MALASTASRRYAEALVNAAEAKGPGELDRAKNELLNFASTTAQVFDLKNVLLNPIFTQQERDQALAKMMDKLGLSETTRRFLELLVEKDRISEVEEIAESVRALADARAGRVRAHIRTPMALSSDETEKLRHALEKRTGKKVDLDVQLDETLIGGIQAKIGSQVLDGTIRAELNRLRGILEARN